jgi:hypothetical protein
MGTVKNISTKTEETEVILFNLCRRRKEILY